MRSMRRGRTGGATLSRGGRSSAGKALAWPSAGAEAQRAQIEAIEAQLGVETPAPGSAAPYQPLETGAKAWGL